MLCVMLGKSHIHNLETRNIICFLYFSIDLFPAKKELHLESKIIMSVDAFSNRSTQSVRHRLNEP